MAFGLTSAIVDNGIESLGRFYSIYRGVVMDTVDELGMDRIQVYVPTVDTIVWALPMGQHGSLVSGFRLFPLPKVQDIVFVMFEMGNPGNALWTYAGWAQDQMPEEFQDTNVCGIVTPNGTLILINDTTGEINIYAKNRLSIQAEGKDGIAISANKISLNSSDQIIINQGKQGVPDIEPLTQKLNQLVKEVDNLRKAFNTHTHSGVQSGTSNTPPPTGQVTTPISTFNKTDYEDTSLLH